MRKRAKKFSVAAVALGGAIGLAACGIPSSSHVALGVPSHVGTATAPSSTSEGASATTSARGSAGERGTVGGRTTGSSTSTTGTPGRGVTATTSAGTSPVGNPAGSGSSSQSQASASPVDQQTLNEVAAQLGALGQSLNQATSDLDNPQGDS